MWKCKIKINIWIILFKLIKIFFSNNCNIIIYLNLIIIRENNNSIIFGSFFKFNDKSFAELSSK